VSGYPGGYAVLLAVALCTHALVGYTLGELLFGAPRAGAVGGVLADVDLLFPAAWPDPFVHRGITHTALAAGVATAVAAAHARRTAGAVGTGYTAQLLVDATTAKGVPLLYPLVSAHVGVELGSHSGPATAALWIACLGLLWHRRLRSRRTT